LTIIFVFATATIPSYVAYAGGTISVVILVALFVTLIPTTIGALLSAIGIAGMDRLVRFNVLAMSGRAVEAAGDVRAISVESRFEALHATGLTALVGREEESELLLRRWSRAKNSEGQVVLLSGEAGIGKSRSWKRTQVIQVQPLSECTQRKADISNAS
jgi:hypothetical protein